jgi:hypothetical protein
VTKLVEKAHLSAKGLLGKVRTLFQQILGAVLAHSEHKNVIPLCPEAY